MVPKSIGKYFTDRRDVLEKLEVVASKSRNYTPGKQDTGRADLQERRNVLLD